MHAVASCVLNYWYANNFGHKTSGILTLYIASYIVQSLLHTHAHTHTHIYTTHTHTHTHTHMHTHILHYSDQCDCAVKLYSEPNFKGRSVEVIHTQNARLANEGFDDQAASARVVGTCSWLFYSSDNFGGYAYLLYPGEYYSNLAWGAQGRSLSSVRALPAEGTVAIALFDGYNFAGRMVVLYESVANLQTESNFNNRASSVIVVNGVWKLYDSYNYLGSSIEVPPGYHYPSGLGTILTQNRVSSIKLKE